MTSKVHINNTLDCELHIDGKNHGSIRAIDVVQDTDTVYTGIGQMYEIKTGDSYTTFTLEFYEVCVKGFIGTKKMENGKEKWILSVHPKELYSAQWNGPELTYYGPFSKEWADINKKSLEAKTSYEEVMQLIHEHVIDVFKGAAIVGDGYAFEADGIYVSAWDDDEGGRYGMMNVLPGLKDVRVCPDSNCGRKKSLYLLIQHLNDSHMWTREKIADWLESLDVDLTFPIGEENDKD